VALERDQHLCDPVRQLRPQQSAAQAQSGEICLLAESLGEPQAPGDDRLGVQIYDRVFLTSEGTLCDLGIDRAGKVRVRGGVPTE
jgi:hypothetical protein